MKHLGTRLKLGLILFYSSYFCKHSYVLMFSSNQASLNYHQLRVILKTCLLFLGSCPRVPSEFHCSPAPAASFLLPPESPWMKTTRKLSYCKTSQITQGLGKEYPAPSSLASAAACGGYKLSVPNLHVCHSYLLHHLVHIPSPLSPFLFLLGPRNPTLSFTQRSASAIFIDQSRNN